MKIEIDVEDLNYICFVLEKYTFNSDRSHKVVKHLESERDMTPLQKVVKKKVTNEKKYCELCEKFTKVYLVKEKTTYCSCGSEHNENE